MQPSATIIKDSVNRWGNRLVTAELTFHRFVLAEFNTHRVFSRNSASSRAIPVEKQLGKVEDTPAWPVEWASEQPGMQGGTELEGDALIDAQALFMAAQMATTSLIQQYLEMRPEKSERLHKSLINRLLEPFMWHTVIVTSTDWDNYFAQRSSYFSPLAQPEIRVVSDLLFDAMEASSPVEMEAGEWHLPLIQDDELNKYSLDTLRQASAARCARVSYLTHEGVRDINKDLELFARLREAKPPHASPFEHVATPVSQSWELTPGNFQGWRQLRHIVLDM